MAYEPLLTRGLLTRRDATPKLRNCFFEKGINTND